MYLLQVCKGDLKDTSLQAICSDLQADFEWSDLLQLCCVCPCAAKISCCGNPKCSLMAVHADLGSLGSSYQGLSNTAGGEAVWCLDLIPILL